MTIREFLNLDSYDKDRTTGEELTHEQKYDKLIDLLGRDSVIACVPFTAEQIKREIKKDRYLNTLSMKKWDMAGGFIVTTNYKTGTQDIRHFRSQLSDIFVAHGINSWSPADGVCTLKEAARLMVQEVK